jgi:TRAP-type transport system periplasmic protein
MPAPIEIRMGGYGPPTTGFSRALKFIGDRLEAEFGAEIEVKYVWNIMSLGYRGEDILWLVERGLLTLGYQSTSYFTDRVRELEILDLPFVFQTRDRARAAFDGALGKTLAARIEARMDYRILGYFENGFRHISNRLRPIHGPADLKGMRIRVLPSDVQVRTFELWGAVPLKWDLTEAIAAIQAGTIDAQENPLANTVTYGVHKFHRFHTLSSHFYLSRPIFLHRPSFDAWPEKLRHAMAHAVEGAIVFQRGLAIEEETESAAAIRDAGGAFVTLTEAERAAFVVRLKPLYAEARKNYPREILSLLPAALP